MKTRNFVLCALGLAAAITFGGAATASAQARSDTRIPVRKDAPPMETKVDTIRLPGRVDTVMVRGRTDTVRMTVDRMRYDTVMQMLPMQRLPNFYFGLGAGVAIPMNNWRNFNKDGWDGQVQMGYFPGNSNLGIRVDGNYAYISERDTGCPRCPATKVIAGSADLIFRIPLDRMSKLNPVVYLIGGGGVDKILDFIPYRNSDSPPKLVTAGKETFLSGPIPVTAALAGSKDIFFHYEAGAGLDVRLFNSLNTFVETKYSTLNTINGNSHYWPVVIGLKFY